MKYMSMLLFLAVGILTLSSVYYYFFATSDKLMYHDAAYGFSVALPKSFFDDGSLSGAYTYSKYFATRHVGSMADLAPGDVSVTVTVSKDETQMNSSVALASARAISQVRNTGTVAIDGMSAVEEFEDYTAGGSSQGGCQFAAYFTDRGVSHSITMWSSDCTKVDSMQSVFSSILSSF